MSIRSKLRMMSSPRSFFKLLVDNKVNVIRFDLSELSLHEIFVKEVGADEK